MRAAIVVIMVKTGFNPGTRSAIALPTQAPVKNRGIINPPRHSPFTVTLIAIILANANSNNAIASALFSTIDLIGNSLI